MQSIFRNRNSNSARLSIWTRITPIGHYFYAEVLILQKRFDEAVAEMEKKPFNPCRNRPITAAISATPTRRPARTLGKPEESSVNSSRKQKQNMFPGWESPKSMRAWVKKIIGSPRSSLPSSRGDTRMNTIRARTEVDSMWPDDPRFAELLKKIGLPPLK